MRRHDLKHYPGFGSLTWFCLVLLYAPMLVIMVYSFNELRSITTWGGFSFAWYEKALTNPQLHSATFNSVVVALSAATLGTILALCAALAMARGRQMKGQSAGFVLINLPLMVPEIVTAIGSLVFFLAIGIELGLVTIIIAHTVFCIPFAYLPIAARLQGLEGYYEEAARDLYATRWETFRHVTLPLTMPGIIAGYMLAFIVSLDDFIITNMVAGPGATTLPMAIYGMVRTGFTPEINAISTLMLLVSALFVSASYLIGRKGKNE